MAPVTTSSAPGATAAALTAGAPDAAVAPATAVPWLLRPDPSLSFKFLTLAYLFLALVTAMFAALQFIAKVPQVSGFFIVPLPSVFALPYVALLWRRQHVAQHDAGSAVSAAVATPVGRAAGDKEEKKTR